MDAEEHRQLRELLGSYAVGALSRREAERVQVHLDNCPECRALLEELTPVASALSALDVDAVTGTAGAEPPPVEPLLARLGQERRRRRLRATAGALVATAAAVVLAVVLLSGGESGEPPAPLADERPLRSLTEGVSGSVRLTDRDWGTQVSLEARGLPADRRLVLWLERADGTRVPAGTFNGIGDALLRADLAAGVRPRDTEAVGVSEAGGADLLALTVDR